MKKTAHVYLFLSLLLLSCVCNVEAMGGRRSGTKDIADMPDSAWMLWYGGPAQKWVQALPVGNGWLGGMVFGGIGEELIQLNADTLWAGPPIPKDVVGARTYIDQARALIFEGKYSEAQTLIQDNAMGERISPRSYQTLGDLKISFQHGDKASEYRRELNLSEALAKTTFKIDGVTYTREVFSSAVDDCIVIHISADKPGMVSFEATLDRPADFVTTPVGKNQLVMQGQASQKGKHRGVKYEAQLTARTQNGTVATEGNHLTVSGADSVVLYLTAATDYNMDDPMKPLTADRGEVCSSRLRKVARKSYSKVRKEHTADHQQLFNRFSIDLGNGSSESLPTDERLAAVKKGADDPGLIALYCQFGRYLLISCSRPGCMPSNLQGLWNDRIAAPWNSDYHININVQMNYWPAEVTNLSECHLPFFDFTERLLPSGRKTARDMFGSRGATAGHTTDAWLWTSIFGKVGYGMWPMGFAWSSQHFMEHYRFTGDKAFLAERAYPVLKEAAEFFLGYLVEDPRTGKLVSGPSTSPENKFVAPDGKVVSIDMGVSMDQEIIWDTFTNCLEAAEVLGIEDEFTREVKATLGKIALPKIGSDGRLMEWTQEFEEPQPGHRHISHLYAIHPGRQYTQQNAPEMVAAARKSIEHRLANGGGHTGWSRAWIINFWARFHDGQKAHENVKALLAKSTHPNLFDTHPPFQIDGNYGGTAGIVEMLIQSHAGEIELLPALPTKWKDGAVRGLRARGGFEIDMLWKDGNIVSATIKSMLGKPCRIRTGNSIEVKDMREYSSSGNVIEFKTKRNRIYQLNAVSDI